MKCDVSKFDLTKTWILLNAGKNGKKESSLERRILNSISTHINEFEPNSKNIYGRIADIILFERTDIIADYKGIGATSIARILGIREYLSHKRTYCWILGKTIAQEKKTEVENMMSFGDMNKEPEQKTGKKYVITINGFVSDDIRDCVYQKASKKYTINLTKEEHKGIEKFFEALRKSKFDSITGMGVEKR